MLCRCHGMARRSDSLSQIEGLEKHDMKKLITSAGLIAVGASSLHAAAYAPDLNEQQRSKTWTLSASLRGFYDDNVNTTPVAKQRSFGVDVRPGAAINIPLDQTLISARDRKSTRLNSSHSSVSRMPSSA